MSGDKQPACPMYPPVKNLRQSHCESFHADRSSYWLHTGIVIEGCPSTIQIDNCLTLVETSDLTEMLDNGAPKQRIEFYEGKVKGTLLVPRTFTDQEPFFITCLIF